MKKACPPARPTQKPPMDFISPSRILEEGHLRRGSDGSSVQATATKRELTRRQSPPSEAHAWETTCETPYPRRHPAANAFQRDGCLPRRLQCTSCCAAHKKLPVLAFLFAMLVTVHSTSVLSHCHSLYRNVTLCALYAAFKPEA
jgi:hypothetical protein